jgi:hypothetical protein
MTKLLDQALDAVRLLPPDEQDEIARVMMQLAGTDLPATVRLSDRRAGRDRPFQSRGHAR